MTKNEITQIPKVKPKKFSILCTFNHFILFEDLLLVEIDRDRSLINRMKLETLIYNP
jgi:hypothetical protein